MTSSLTVTSPTGPSRHFVVIGGDMARRVCGSLQATGHLVRHLAQPTDEELRGALHDDVAGAAMLLDDDAESLRYALAVEHIRPSLRLVVSIFDRTVGEQLVRYVPNCHVTSPADVAAPVLLAACLQPGLLALTHTSDGHAGISWNGDDAASAGSRTGRRAR